MHYKERVILVPFALAKETYKRSLCHLLLVKNQRFTWKNHPLRLYSVFANWSSKQKEYIYYHICFYNYGSRVYYRWFHKYQVCNSNCHRLHWGCIAVQKYYTYEMICLATLNSRVSGKFERMIDHAKWHVRDLPQILKARFIVKTKILLSHLFYWRNLPIEKN